ncbi:transporter substrate-binding domain-containing protein [Anaeromyxobacter sp. PSR-1]|uniref:transporter substrate-binding domain-containing protein n=1 Tax=Anaeromyxobacter sp. PSR-1 TaxID=1300915 RepID=UPI0005E201FD|nr:transporter substrate-binding domain-containing protein [Anaeromyxobacter sp. PSR-1]GAO01851.1 putative sensor protein [Anaeromyxobacter sp. PSR-1]
MLHADADPPGRRASTGQHLLRASVALGCALALAAPAVAADGAPSGRAPARERVIVGGDQSYPPYEFLDQQGRPAGFNVDLTRAVARTVGLEVEFRLGRWADMRRALESGEIDALQGMSFSEERAREVDFTPPSLIVHHAIFARKGDRPVRSLADLAGKEVLVLRSGIMHDTLRREHPEVKVVPADTHADVLRQLAAGRHDYAVMAKLPGLYLIREMGLSKLTAMDQPAAVERYGFAVRRGNEALAARLAEGLAIVRNTGEYQAMSEAWLGVLEPRGPSVQQMLRWGAFVVIPLVLLLATMAAWSRTLHRQVAVRTADLTREIAERKQKEEELRANQQQLLQADKMAALGVLVSGVAHEINNPNGLILLDLQVLDDVLRDATPILDAHAREQGDYTLGSLRWSRLREALPGMVSDALGASRRVKRIVEDLKDFARQGPPELRDGVSIDEVVGATARLVEALVKKSTDRFEVQLAPGLPAIRGSPQRLEQVLVNLLVNACQALPDRSRGIRLRTYVDAAKGAVCVEVRDEGVGIEPEHLARLTDPFFTTKRDTGGTGLGLAVSAGIVKEHGGTLEFESAPGQGTTVRMLLPVPRREAA